MLSNEKLALAQDLQKYIYIDGLCYFTTVIVHNLQGHGSQPHLKLFIIHSHTYSNCRPYKVGFIKRQNCCCRILLSQPLWKLHKRIYTEITETLIWSVPLLRAKYPITRKAVGIVPVLGNLLHLNRLSQSLAQGTKYCFFYIQKMNKARAST
jgi:hypothetical protein